MFCNKIHSSYHLLFSGVINFPVHNREGLFWQPLASHFLSTFDSCAVNSNKCNNKKIDFDSLQT